MSRAPHQVQLCRATPRDVARALPQADAARVRDVLALAGPDALQAVAVLAAAIGTLVGQRVDLAVQPAVVGGVSVVIANTALLHAQRPAGRG